MKRTDENGIAERLGQAAPPPPPDLAVRLRGDIPDHVEVPPALTRPPAGTLPFARRPVARRLLALAATLLVVVAAGLVARRVLLPTGAPPLEVALVESAPSADQAAAPAPAAPVVVARQEARPPASPVEPLAKATAPAPARGPEGKGRRDAAADSAQPAEAPAPQVAAPSPVQVAASEAMAAAARPPERDAVEGGVSSKLVSSASAPLDDEAGVFRVGGPVATPEIIHRVDPEYPEAARRAGVQGEVVIEALIDRDGTVRETRLVRNTTQSDACAESALRAVRAWRYRPAQLEGRPVAVYLTLTVAFGPGGGAAPTGTPRP